MFLCFSVNFPGGGKIHLTLPTSPLSNIPNPRVVTTICEETITWRMKYFVNLTLLCQKCFSFLLKRGIPVRSEEPNIKNLEGQGKLQC